MAESTGSDLTNNIKLLMSRKDEIEKEIKQLMLVLDEQGHVGLDGPLVDRDQFPRSDIDVYAVRQTRNKIACLQNDHKSIMREIENGLHELHATVKIGQKMTSSNDAEPMVVDDSSTSAKPFIRVNRVDQGSPASEAGLEIEDLILRFGSINASNFTDLKGIATLAEHSKGSAVHVSVLRGSRPVQLSLTPKQWAGRGLLGCNVVPYKS